MTTNDKLPIVPTLDSFLYKHYYILKDMRLDGRFYLYLLMDEPAAVCRDKNSNVQISQKYGRSINRLVYIYDTGQCYTAVLKTP